MMGVVQEARMGVVRRACATTPRPPSRLRERIEGSGLNLTGKMKIEGCA